MTEISNNTPKSRLLLFCRAVGLGRNKDIERLFSLGNGYFKSMGGGMNTDSISKIISIYPNLNLHWLITGQGSMFAEPTQGLRVAEHNGSFLPKDDYNVPVRSFSSAESFMTDSSFLPPSWRMLPKSAIRTTNDVLIRITDDSLTPEYMKGDYILFSPSVIPSRGEKRLMLCSLYGGKVIIRIAECMDDEGKIISLRAINRDRVSYPDIICPSDDIGKCYDAVGVFGF